MSDTPDEKMPDEPMDRDLIMPYADGVLPPEQRAAVRDALASDPELMQEFESFLFTRGPMPRAFDEVLAAPVPERLLAAVRAPAPAPAPARSAGSRDGGPSLLERIGDLFRMPAFSPAVAIPAVLVAAAAGWLAGTALHPDSVPPERRAHVASALQKALEQTPSGSTANIADGLTLKPTLTFASVQTWCRQYELDQGSALRSQGLACRMPDGNWRVLAVTEPEPRPAPPRPGTFEAAGNVDTLEDLRGALKRGDVLKREEVEGLIKDGWSSKPRN
jgi:surface antigen